MTIYKAICIKEQTYIDGTKTLTLVRGKEYTVGDVDANGERMVFSTYWVKVPAELFAGVVKNS